MLRVVLEAAGYDVDTVSNGIRALGLVSRSPAQYRVVITDMRMPGMDGYQLISEARVAGYAGSFVALAGSLSPDDRQRLRELRVIRVLDKPSRSTDIIDAVREALSWY